MSAAGNRTVVTLTTDFGLGNRYVAAMKGVLLSLAPQVNIVDLSHAVAPQDVRGGAIVLMDAAPWFPDGSVHVVVVDPGVGTSRRILAARKGSHCFIGPDNGVLEAAFMDEGPDELVEVSAAEFRLPKVSATFHGRDVMAPAAAHLCRGVSLRRLGARVNDPLRLDWPEPTWRDGRLIGEVIFVDSFGNLITNIRDADLSVQRATQVRVAPSAPAPVVDAYAAAEGGTIVGLFGSSGRLEVARVNGSAHESLPAGVGAQVIVEGANPPGNS